VQVAIGIDTHKGSLAAAAVDALGRVLDVREFTNDPTGHRSLLRWVKEQAQPRTIGIEGSLSYGSAAARMLLGHAEDVREVAALLTHQERRRRAKGKSDPVDAVAIARVVAADETLPSARRTTLLTDLKLLVDYRDQLVHARTQVSNRIHADLVIIRPGTSRWCRTCERSGTWQRLAPSSAGIAPCKQSSFAGGLERSCVLRPRSRRPTGGSPTSSLRPIPP